MLLLYRMVRCSVVVIQDGEMQCCVVQDGEMQCCVVQDGEMQCCCYTGW